MPAWNNDGMDRRPCSIGGGELHFDVRSEQLGCARTLPGELEIPAGWSRIFGPSFQGRLRSGRSWQSPYPVVPSQVIWRVWSTSTDRQQPSFFVGSSREIPDTTWTWDCQDGLPPQPDSPGSPSGSPMGSGNGGPGTPSLRAGRPSKAQSEDC